MTMTTAKLSDFSTVRVVAFDLGFTLWNEERVWNQWASRLRVSPLEVFAILGSIIERGEHHNRTFDVVCPGFDISRERQRMSSANESDSFRPDELYPDAIPCLTELRAAGYRTGVAGNFFVDFTETLQAMNAPLDFIGSSAEWGIEKPSPEFFSHIVRVSGVSTREIAYLGDRLDNDVLPAKAAGMVSVFLRRGPWGRIHSRRSEAAEADIQIDSLAELVPPINRRQHGSGRPFVTVLFWRCRIC